MYAAPVLGYMPMPENFRYREVCLAGRPKHDKNDLFYHRHPAMGLSQRAKIFAPFDALRGFSDEIASREARYERRHVPGEEEARELDMRLRSLAALTKNGREARKNRVEAAVTYFVPAAGSPDRGIYESVTGICLMTGPGCLRIMTGGREKRIAFEDIRDITIIRRGDGGK